MSTELPKWVTAHESFLASLRPSKTLDEIQAAMRAAQVPNRPPISHMRQSVEWCGAFLSVKASTKANNGGDQVETTIRLQCDCMDVEAQRNVMCFRLHGSLEQHEIVKALRWLADTIESGRAEER